MTNWLGTQASHCEKRRTLFWRHIACAYIYLAAPKKNTYYYSKNFIFGFRAKEKLCGGFQNYVYPEKLNMPYQNQEKQAKFVVIDDRRDIPWASFIHTLCGIAGKWLRVQWLRVCDNKYCGSHVYCRCFARIARSVLVLRKAILMCKF